MLKQKSYSLERKSVQKMVVLVMNGCRKRKIRTNFVKLFVNGQFELVAIYYALKPNMLQKVAQ